MLPGAHIVVANAISLNITKVPIAGLILGIINHHIFDYLPHLDTNILENYKDFTFKQLPLNIKIPVIAEMVLGFLFSLIYFVLIYKKDLLVFLFISIGALLPDVINIFFKNYANKYGFGKRYINFHKKFHFVLKSKSTKAILYAGIIEVLIIIISLAFFNLSNNFI